MHNAQRGRLTESLGERLPRTNTLEGLPLDEADSWRLVGLLLLLRPAPASSAVVAHDTRPGSGSG